MISSLAAFLATRRHYLAPILLTASAFRDACRRGVIKSREWGQENLLVGEFQVGVEWKQEHGFGISSFRADCSSSEGMFDSPSEWYSTEQAAFHRVASLVFAQRSTTPRLSRISEIRHERGISQEALSQQLSVKQATYSKLERCKDVKVSSLRQVIEAMGGKLVMQAVFADSKDVREITFQ